MDEKMWARLALALGGPLAFNYGLFSRHVNMAQRPVPSSHRQVPTASLSVSKRNLPKPVERLVSPSGPFRHVFEKLLPPLLWLGILPLRVQTLSML